MTSYDALIVPMCIWYSPPSHRITSTLISLEDNRFITGSDKGHIVIWKIFLKEASKSLFEPYIIAMAKEAVPIRALQMIPYHSRKCLASVCSNGSIAVWSLDNGQCQISKTGAFSNRPIRLLVLPDEKHLISAGHSNILEVLELKSLSVVKRIVQDSWPLYIDWFLCDHIPHLFCISKNHMVYSWALEKLDALSSPKNFFSLSSKSPADSPCRPSDGDGHFDLAHSALSNMGHALLVVSPEQADVYSMITFQKIITIAANRDECQEGSDNLHHFCVGSWCDDFTIILWTKGREGHLYHLPSSIFPCLPATKVHSTIESQHIADHMNPDNKVEPKYHKKKSLGSCQHHFTSNLTNFTLEELIPDFLNLISSFSTRVIQARYQGLLTDIFNVQAVNKGADDKLLKLVTLKLGASSFTAEEFHAGSADNVAYITCGDGTISFWVLPLVWEASMLETALQPASTAKLASAWTVGQEARSFSAFPDGKTQDQNLREDERARLRRKAEGRLSEQKSDGSPRQKRHNSRKKGNRGLSDGVQRKKSAKKIKIGTRSADTIERGGTTDTSESNHSSNHVEGACDGSDCVVNVDASVDKDAAMDDSPVIVDDRAGSEYGAGVGEMGASKSGGISDIEFRCYDVGSGHVSSAEIGDQSNNNDDLNFVDYVCNDKDDYQECPEPRMFSSVNNVQRTVTSSLLLESSFQMICGYSDGSISLINLPSKASVISWSAHASAILHLLSSPSSGKGWRLISAGKGCRIRIWEVTSRAISLVKTFYGHSGPIEAIFFPPVIGKPTDLLLQVPITGRWNTCFLSVGEDMQVGMFDYANLRHIGTFGGHPAPIEEVSWNPIENILLVKCVDESLTIWEISTGYQQGVVTGKKAQEMLAHSGCLYVKSRSWLGQRHVGMALRQAVVGWEVKIRDESPCHLVMFNVQNMARSLKAWHENRYKSLRERDTVWTIKDKEEGKKGRRAKEGTDEDNRGGGGNKGDGINTLDTGGVNGSGKGSLGKDVQEEGELREGRADSRAKNSGQKSSEKLRIRSNRILEKSEGKQPNRKKQIANSLRGGSQESIGRYDESRHHRSHLRRGYTKPNADERRSRGVSASAPLMNSGSFSVSEDSAAASLKRNKQLNSSSLYEEPYLDMSFESFRAYTCFLPWTLNPSLDEMMISSFHLRPMEYVYSFGLLGDDMTISMLVPRASAAAGRWTCCHLMSAIHSLAVLCLTRSLMSFEASDSKRNPNVLDQEFRCTLAGNQLLSFLTNELMVKTRPGYKLPSLSAISMFYQDPLNEMLQGAQSLFEYALSSLSADQFKLLLLGWSSKLDINSNSTELHSRSITASELQSQASAIFHPSYLYTYNRAVLVLSMIGCERPNELSSALSLSLTLEIIDLMFRQSNTQLQSVAAEIFGKGFRLWSQHLNQDIVSIILKLFRMSTLSESRHLSETVFKALFVIGKKSPKQLVYAVQELFTEVIKCSGYFINRKANSENSIFLGDNQIVLNEYWNTKLMSELIFEFLAQTPLKTPSNIKMPPEPKAETYSPPVVEKTSSPNSTFDHSAHIPHEESKETKIYDVKDQKLLSLFSNHNIRHPLRFTSSPIYRSTHSIFQKPHFSSFLNLYKEYCNVLILLVKLIKVYPARYYSELTALTDSFLKTLYLYTHISPVCQNITSICNLLLNVLDRQYPMLSFEEELQQLAIGTPKGGLIIYDLKSGNKLNFVEAYSHAAISALIFGAKKTIATYSVEARQLKIWKFTSIFFGALVDLHCVRTICIPNSVHNYWTAVKKKQSTSDQKSSSIDITALWLEELKLTWVNDDVLQIQRDWESEENKIIQVNLSSAK